jgi:hypothetical protein
VSAKADLDVVKLELNSRPVLSFLAVMHDFLTVRPRDVLCNYNLSAGFVTSVCNLHFLFLYGNYACFMDILLSIFVPSHSNFLKIDFL